MTLTLKIRQLLHFIYYTMLWQLLCCCLLDGPDQSAGSDTYIRRSKHRDHEWHLTRIFRAELCDPQQSSRNGLHTEWPRQGPERSRSAFTTLWRPFTTIQDGGAHAKLRISEAEVQSYKILNDAAIKWTDSNWILLKIITSIKWPSGISMYRGFVELEALQGT